MCGRFGNAILDAFSRAVGTVCRGKSLGVMRCARFETTPQMATIAPERSEVIIVNQRVEIGESTRSGFFELVLPLSVIDPIKQDLMQHFGSPSALNSDLWERSLRGNLMQARLDLDAVLETQTIPLHKLSALKVGDTLMLNAGALDEVSLRTHTSAGESTLARCRLGAKGGLKAVKLMDAPRADIVRLLRIDA
jgi:flagellar motor switch protein FliM